MSKPLENYIIRIKSSIDQFDNEGVIREEDRDHIELMTRGSFTKKNGSYYISYKETQTIGFEGCTTTIKIAEDGSRAALLRFGKVNTQLAAARSEYDYLSTRMSDITSRASLQEVAEGQLGLVKLDPSQITYVQLEDESVIQKSTNTAGKLLGEVRTAALSLLNNLNP